MPFVEIHTHLLPQIDDGAKDVETSVKMLEAFNEQGAKCVIATPHFDFRRISIDDFEMKRKEAYEKLRLQLELENKKDLCPVYLGAEIMYSSHISSFVDLSRLTLGDKPYILIEFASHLTEKIIEDVSHIARSSDFGLILAHTERYADIGFLRKLKKLSSLDIKFQSNYDSFTSDSPFRRAAHTLMENGYVDFLATDAHNLTSRPPDFRKELELLTKEYGLQKIERIISRSLDFFNF